MVKLTAAKCPNCGADIEVNENLKNTICQQCGSTVIIEEAIEKKQLELTGSIQVEGISNRNSEFKKAKKHIAIDEINQAEKILLKLIEADSFDAEAYIELLKIDLGKIEKMENFKECSSDFTQRDGWALLNEIGEYYDRIQKIDEDKIADKQLADCMDKLNHYLDLLNESRNFEQEGIELQKINEYLKRMKVERMENVSGDIAEKWVTNVVQKYFLASDYNTSYGQTYNGQYYGDKYRLVQYSRLTPDGFLEGEYVRVTNNYTSSNPKTENLHPIAENGKYESIEDTKEAVKKLLEETEEFIKSETDLVMSNAKKQINTNKRTAIGTTILGIIAAAWSIFMVVMTILCFKDGIGAGILFVLIFDTWALRYPAIFAFGMLSAIISSKDEVNKIKKYKEDFKI